MKITEKCGGLRAKLCAKIARFGKEGTKSVVLFTMDMSLGGIFVLGFESVSVEVWEVCKCVR